jgi:hypothetical protein
MNTNSEPPIFDVKERMPGQWQSPRVWLADGRRTWATWTGKVWWGESHEMDVVRWQHYEPPFGDSSDMLAERPAPSGSLAGQGELGI